MRVPDGPACREAGAGRGWEGPSEGNSQTQSPRGCVCRTQVSMEQSLGPHLLGLLSKEASQPVLPSLARCLGKAPYSGNGRRPRHVSPHVLRSITCPQRTHTDPRLCLLADSRGQPKAHMCPTGRHTSTRTCLPSVRPSGVNTRIRTPRDSQHPPDTGRPSGTDSQPTGPTRRDVKQMGSPRLRAPPRLVSTRVRAALEQLA